MCGIVGAIAERNIVPILMEGLRRLEYRGYDSAGLAVLNGSKQWTSFAPTADYILAFAVTNPALVETRNALRQAASALRCRLTKALSENLRVVWSSDPDIQRARRHG